MAGIGGFLGGLGLAAGRNIIVGQEMANTQSEIDLRKADIAEKQQRMAAIAQQQQTAKAVGDYISTEAQKDSSVVTDPIKSAKLYENATAFALRAGDFASANTMSQLAKEKLNEAKEAAQVQAQQMQLKKEDLANEADSFATNPTQEGANRLVQKAVDAGVNPQSIPKNPNSPEFRAWVGQQQLASKTASQRADFIEKTKEAQEKTQEKKEEFAQREQDRHVQMQQTALLRESAAEDRKARLSIEQERVDLLKANQQAKANAPEKLGIQTQHDTTALAGAGAESARNLRQISNFSIGTGTSPFTNLTDHTVLDAIAKAGTNDLTPDTIQMFNTAGAGLALQVGRVETIGAGKGVNKAQVDQLEKQLVPVGTDQPLTKLYKVATGADLVATRLENQPPPRDPTLRKKWDDTITELRKYPKPEDVLAIAQRNGKSKQIINFNASYQDNLDRVRADVAAHPATGEESPVPSAAPAGASVPGLPSGGLTPSDNDLINKYLKK